MNSRLISQFFPTPFCWRCFGRHRNDACATPTIDSRKNNGVYRSMDGGATWQKITQSLANGFNTAIPGDVGRIALQVAPSNPKHIYIQIARSDTSQAPGPTKYSNLGIFDTLDATADPVVWKAENSTTNYLGSNTGSQGWYDIAGAVDPTNENRIIVGGLDNYLSTIAVRRCPSNPGGARLTRRGRTPITITRCGWMRTRISTRMTAA